MSLALFNPPGSDVVTVRVIDRMSIADYRKLVRRLHRYASRGLRMRILFEAAIFMGMPPRANAKACRFVRELGDRFDRIAVVSETKWAGCVLAFFGAFRSASVRHFDHDQSSEARAWVHASLGIDR